jgi:hypothetical protein
VWAEVCAAGVRRWVAAVGCGRAAVGCGYVAVCPQNAHRMSWPPSPFSSPHTLLLAVNEVTGSIRAHLNLGSDLTPTLAVVWQLLRHPSRHPLRHPSRHPLRHPLRQPPRGRTSATIFDIAHFFLAFDENKCRNEFKHHRARHGPP